MIVECKSCHTKFRVADDKVTARGIKVRCSKCQHTFMVRKDESAAEAPAAAPVTAPAAATDEAVTRVSKLPTAGQPARTMQMFAVSPADVRQNPQAASFDLDTGVTTDPFSVPDTQAAQHRGFDDREVPPTSPLGGTSPFAAEPSGESTRRLAAPPPPGADPFAARKDLFGAAVSFDGSEPASEVPPFTASATAPAKLSRFVDPFAAAAAATHRPPAAADDPFGLPPQGAASAPSSAAEASAADPFAAASPAAAPGPAVADPFAVASPAASPAPAATDPFAALGPPPAVPGNGGVVDPFGALGADAPAPFSPPPGPAAGADPLALPAGASPMPGVPEDIFGGFGQSAPEPGGLPWDPGASAEGFHNPVDAETRVRTVDDDMLKMLASYSQTEQAQAEPKVPDQPAPRPEVAATKPARTPDPGHPLLWQVMQGLLGLVLAGGVLLGVFHFRGGRFENPSPGHLFSVVLFGEQAFADARLLTADLDVTYYPVTDAQRLVVVSGQVRNRGGDDLPAVVVRGTLRDGDGAEVGSAEVYAGAALDAFDLVRARSPQRLAERIQDRVARAGKALAAGESWPFTLAIAPAGQPDLTRTTVELELRAADAPRRPTGAETEPGEDPAAATGEPAEAEPGAAGSTTSGTSGDPAAAASDPPASPATGAALRPATRPPAKPPARPASKAPPRPARKAKDPAEETPPPPPPPPPPPAG